MSKCGRLFTWYWAEGRGITSAPGVRGSNLGCTGPPPGRRSAAPASGLTNGRPLEGGGGGGGGQTEGGACSAEVPDVAAARARYCSLLTEFWI